MLHSARSLKKFAAVSRVAMSSVPSVLVTEHRRLHLTSSPSRSILECAVIRPASIVAARSAPKMPSISWTPVRAMSSRSDDSSKASSSDNTTEVVEDEENTLTFYQLPDSKIKKYVPCSIARK